MDSIKPNLAAVTEHTVCAWRGVGVGGEDEGVDTEMSKTQ